MTLLGTLGLGRGDVVALAGAGGKTTLVRALALEARAAGLRVLSTSTTHAGPEGVGRLIVEADEADCRQAVSNALAATGAAMLLGRRVDGGRLQGIDPARVEKLRELADIVLVETDGARGRLLKSAAEHEPVVPAATTALVVVASLDALGRPLDARSVHRLERVLAATARGEGSPIDGETLALALLADYPRRRPRAARLLAFLNGAERESAWAAAVAIAGRLVPPFDRVAAGSARLGEAERLPVVDGIVLAAGGSTRMGRAKLLLPYAGEALLARAVRPLLEAGVRRVVVVLGDEAPALRQALPADARITVALNPEWRSGLASSLRAGLAACASADAVLVTLGDQPSVTREVVGRVLAAAPGRSLVVATSGERVVHPILFSRALFAELELLRGDAGAREIVLRHREGVARVAGEPPRDIDTEADYRDALEGRPPRGGEGLV